MEGIIEFPAGFVQGVRKLLRQVGDGVQFFNAVRRSQDHVDIGRKEVFSLRV